MTSQPVDRGARPPTRDPAGPRPRTLRGVVLLYLLPLVIFGLVAYCGLWSLAAGASDFGPPWLLAGLGGVLGTTTIIIAARNARHETKSDRAARTVRNARLFMVAAAIGVLGLGVRTAPTGAERSFVIVVNAVLAAALALYAWLATDITHKPRHPA